MADKEKVVEKKLSYEGMFDFKGMYSFFYTLLVDSGYDVDEKSYKEKSKGDSKDIEISWEAEKKFNDYFKSSCSIGLEIRELKNIEAVKDGKKIKANSGEVKVKMTGVMVTDYKNEWQGNPFLKFLRGLYDKFINTKESKKYQEDISKDVDDSTEQLKAFLVLEGKK